ncbi:hypothetical protein OGAPHI_004128 [Ogataea philodendri]|uniref:Uncharacterized protein n=1 Tax=Ogataea philodendri TaxID=1378263 RepID=A0A9P8P782_9ASCO|nr:uncharacterized protein OGAPHI_004128 [Ogataea philodendri]KAH3665939.1 hypothetical protein OGAPHI_004128 [Ogataea philodendri]
MSPSSPPLTHSQGSNGPVHPIELVVQSLVESPLEVLNLNLTSLYESQAILSTILKRLEEKLGKTEKQIKDYEPTEPTDEISLDEYIAKIANIKTQLKTINAKIDMVEKRVDKIMTNVGVR